MSQRDWIENDYYAVLGVDQGASGSDIRKAYRKLAQQHHPDRNRGDSSAEEKFKRISEAYDVLGDSEKRKQYDQLRGMLRSGYSPFGTGGARRIRVEDLGDLDDLIGGFGPGFGDLFSRLFGAEQGGARSAGVDLESEVSLSFDEALRGTTANVSVRDPFSGRTRRVKTRIPAGVTDGTRIRLVGKGSPGPRGGPPGDLYVRVSVEPHPFFGRKNKDVTLRLPITFAEATLGAQVEVPTPAGHMVKLKVPPGTPSGKTFRIRGKGASVNGASSDLLVTVDLAVPSKLSKEAKDLLEQFAQTQKESPRRHLEEGR